MNPSISYLEQLEAESIHILRESVVDSTNLVMLFSAGKDSTAMAHLALRAFCPGKPPFPLLHVDSTWEFQSLLEFRDSFAQTNGMKLVVFANEQGRRAGINPFDHGEHSPASCAPSRSSLPSTQEDMASFFGGGRRDEEKARAKERVCSIRNANRSRGFDALLGVGLLNA